MFENFKTDIIYYNTPTDFEMEFNLCGCCRMRLLNDKCADKKTFLLSLSRAVSRSRIIIITAPLFSGDNITQTVASAIGAKTELIDNAKHNINSTAEINVIEKSIPLVTADGVYGGCLIQSGPQTLILLTENKGVRKNIMQSLIHPYIKEIAIGDTISEEDKLPEDTELIPEEEAMLPLIEENDDTDPSEQIITDDDSTDDEDFYYQDDGGIVIDADEEDSPEDDSSYYASEIKDLFIEEKKDDKDDSDEDDYYYSGEYFTDIPEEKPSAFNIWFLILSVILLVTIAVLCYAIFYVPSTKGVEPAFYLQEIFDTMFK